MAGILLQAGDIRIMGAESWLMIHEISFGASGKIGEIEDTVEWVKKIQERVVKIFAVDRGAVDQRCSGGRKRTPVPDGGARAIVVAAGQRSFHIVFVARRDGEADHVDQQILALGPDGTGQARHIERTNLLRQMLGNGGLGKLAGCHA